jgi:hypothetical protein
MRRRIVSSLGQQRNKRVGKVSNLNGVGFRRFGPIEPREGHGKRNLCLDLPLSRQGRPCGRETRPQTGNLSTSGASPETEFAAGMVGPKRFDESTLALRDKDGFSVRATEGEVGRFRGGELYLPL